MLIINVRLVPDKIFRMTASTIFPVGMTTNQLKLLLIKGHMFLNFYGDVVLVYQILMKLMHKNIVCLHSFVVREE